MNLVNSYATLADYKAYVVARGQTASTDAADDGVIQDLLNAASRYIDLQSRRQFYPHYETVLYDIPADRVLYFDDDILQVVTLTNGDSTVIASTEYVLEGKKPPYWKLSLRKNSNITWETPTANDNTEQVISLYGIHGTHDEYTQRGWAAVGTLDEAVINTTTLIFSVAAGHSIVAGNIVKIDNEIYNVVEAGGHHITPIKRGDNGSTAATHVINSIVYSWQPMTGAKMSTLEIANSAYKKRFGQSVGESATVTAAGVVLTPRDIPATAQAFIDSMRQIV